MMGKTIGQRAGEAFGPKYRRPFIERQIASSETRLGRRIGPPTPR